MIKRIHSDLYSGIIILAFSVFFYFMSSDFPIEGKRFPITIIYLLILFAILIILSGVKKSIANVPDERKEDDKKSVTWQQMKTPFFILLITVGYIVLISILGFFISTILFLTSVLLTLKVKGIKGYLLTVIGTSAFLYILFVKLLNVSLPQGIFF